MILAKIIAALVVICAVFAMAGVTCILICGAFMLVLKYIVIFSAVGFALLAVYVICLKDEREKGKGYND